MSLGERPYVCKVCPLRFSTIGHLITHNKIHTSEDNFYFVNFDYEISLNFCFKEGTHFPVKRAN